MSKAIKCITLILFFLLLESVAIAAPIALYTDIASGPRTGGEGNKGAYLSVFGVNFGSDNTAVHVYINDVETDTTIRYFGASKGRSDIQQITVQLGALTGLSNGVSYPVKVTVGGVASNTDQVFMIQPGDIYFVSTAGNDATGVKNDITRPYRYVQTGNTAGLYGIVQAGDTIVMRGGTWTDLGITDGSAQYFAKFYRVMGNAPTGEAAHGPITIMGYPGEDVYISPSAPAYGVISGVNGKNNPTYSKWVTLANLRVDQPDGANDGPINLQVYSNYWRIINNDLSSPATTGTPWPRSGGVAGNGGYVYILGNKIHNIAGANEETHGIYIDGGNDVTGPIEIAYNYIDNVSGGSDIQMYNNGTNGDYGVTDNVWIHHNILSNNGKKHGINLAEGSGAGIKIYNNIVYSTSRMCVRLNSLNFSGLSIYNNTFYNCGTDASYRVALQNEWASLSSSELDVRNNIFWPRTTNGYLYGDFGSGTFYNNLWYNAGSAPAGDTHSFNSDPKFVTNGSDFHLQASSPAIDNGTSTLSFAIGNDYALISRPQGATIDIGAYEYDAGAGDTAPSQFSFTDVTGAALSTQYTSDNVTVTAIDNTTTIALTGTGCEYSINGGAFATADDNVSLNDNVALRVTSSGDYSTAKNCVLNLGGVSDTYTVTTLAAVLDPVAPRMRAGSMAGGWR